MRINVSKFKSYKLKLDGNNQVGCSISELSEQSHSILLSKFEYFLAFIVDLESSTQKILEVGQKFA